MLPPTTIKRVTRAGLAIIAVCIVVLLFFDIDPDVKLYFVFAIILTAILIAVVRDKPAPPPEEPLPPPVSGNFGTARFGPAYDVITEQTVEGVASGVFFGRSSSPETKGNFSGQPVCSRPGHHTILIAKTGSGKGTKAILPTLLRGYESSIWCIDVKAENAAVSARARRAHSDVHIMNPWGEHADHFARLGFAPATYNLLDMLDRNDPNAVSIAQALAVTICPQEGDEKNSFWNSKAAELLTAILLWLTDQPGETKTLARVREIVGLSRKQLRDDFLVGMVTTGAFSGAIKEHAAQFIDMAPETYSGVSSNLGRYTSFLSDPQIKAATARSSFAMADLTGAGKNRPTTLYLVIPPDRIETQKTWLRLMLTAGIVTFRRQPQGAKYRCLFLLDEFPALGKINGFQTDLATIRAHGVDCALVVQDLAQLRDIYGKADNALLSNCGYKWFCNIKELSTAEYLSKTLGKKTVRTEQKGGSSGESFDMKGWHGTDPTGKTTGESVSYGEVGRDLLTPDEVLNLGQGRAILLSPDSYPQYLSTVDYWRLQEVFAPFRAQSPNLYWPLFFDPNPLLPLYAQAQCPDPLPAAPIRYEFIPINYPRKWATEEPAPGPSAFQKFVNMFRRSTGPTAPLTGDGTIPTTSTWNEGTAPSSGPSPANPPRKIDMLRYAPKSVKDHFANLPPAQPPAGGPPNQPTSSTGEAATEPPPSPVTPPKKIDFRRYAKWKPEDPDSGEKKT